MSSTRLVILGLVFGLGRTAIADSAELEQQYARARNLAANGNCGPVKQIAEHVRTLDEAFYDTVFRADRVILSCGALPGTDGSPSQTQLPPSDACAHVVDVDCFKLTFDVEIGAGFGGFLVEGPDWTPSFNAAAGIGVFINPRRAFGVRAVVESGGPRNFTYAYAVPPPPNSGFIPPPPNTVTEAKRGDTASALIVVDVQSWYSKDVFYDFGAGIGRGHASPGTDSIGPTTYNGAVFARLGLATPFGFELSSQLTSLVGSDVQVNVGLLVGWQLR